MHLKKVGQKPKRLVKTPIKLKLFYSFQLTKSNAKFLTSKSTFGFHRMEVLGSLISLVFLASLSFGTSIEALQVRIGFLFIAFMFILSITLFLSFFVLNLEDFDLYLEKGCAILTQYLLLIFLATFPILSKFLFRQRHFHLINHYSAFFTFQTILHSGHLDLMHQPANIFILACTHMLVWVIVLTLIGGK